MSEYRNLIRERERRLRAEERRYNLFVAAFIVVFVVIVCALSALACGEWMRIREEQAHYIRTSPAVAQVFAQVERDCPVSCAVSRKIENFLFGELPQ